MTVGAARRADYPGGDAEALERGLQPLSVEGYLVAPVGGAGGALPEEVYGRELVGARHGGAALYGGGHLPGGVLGLVLGADGAYRLGYYGPQLALEGVGLRQGVLFLRLRGDIRGVFRLRLGDVFRLRLRGRASA